MKKTIVVGFWFLIWPEPVSFLATQVGKRYHKIGTFRRKITVGDIPYWGETYAVIR